MRKILLSIALCFLLVNVMDAQSRESLPGGRLGMGVRTTLNVFESYKPGLGAGAQWKLSLNKRINTQWFLDYIASREGENVFRKDYHVGWSVQFALLKNGFRGNKVSPYLMAGHCFDLTKVGIADQETSPLVFTSAAQAGAGVSSFVTDNLELTLQTQYMIHLGKDVHVESETHGSEVHQHIHIDKHPGLEGHLLTTFAVNYYFLQIWNR